MGDTHTVTVASSALRALLGDVALGAGTDTGLPMLNGVLLHTDDHPRLGRVLVATATDRFVLLQACVPAQGSLPGRLFLRLRQASQVREVTRPYTTRKRAGSAQTEIVTDGDEATVRQIALPVHGLGTVSITVPIDKHLQFPTVGTLWRSAAEKPLQPEPVAIDSRYLSLLGKLGNSALIDHVGPASMRISHRGAGSAVCAQIGDVLSVLVMPVRQHSNTAEPVFLDIPKHDKPAAEPAVEEAAA